MNDDRFAPDDGVWVCAACGKTAIDRYGIEGPHSYGWDASCMLNAVLCKRGAIIPGRDRVMKVEAYKAQPPDGRTGE